MIAFECRGCGAVLRVGDDKAGKKGKCPKCGAMITVPAPADEAIPIVPLSDPPAEEVAAAPPAGEAVPAPPPPTPAPSATPSPADDLFVRRRPVAAEEAPKHRREVFLAVGSIVVAAAVIAFLFYQRPSDKPRYSPWAAAIVPMAEPKPGADYEIRLNRPQKVGMMLQHNDSGSSKKSQPLTDSGPTQEEIEFERSGVEETLEVDSDGQPTQVAFTVDKCVLIRGGKRAEAAPKGVVVIVTAHRDKPLVHPKDPNVVLSPEAKRVFEEPGFVRIPDPDLDQTFGLPQRGKIGDSWPVQAGYVVDWFSNQMGADVRKEDVSGAAKLVGLVKVADIECLHLHVDLSIKNAAPLGAKLAGDKSESAMSSSMEVAVPLDPSIPVVGAKTTFSASMMVRKDPLNPLGGIGGTIEKTLDVTGVPVKK